MVRERAISQVFLKDFWDIVADDSLKYLHDSTTTEFMWGGVNLMVLWFLFQFVLALSYKVLSLRF